MKAGADRKYTDAFRADAVQQVLEGKRPLMQVARSLEMSNKTLDNWVKKARKGQPLLRRLSLQPINVNRVGRLMREADLQRSNG